MPSVKPPMWYWIVAVAAVLWNAMGAFDYVMTQLEVEAYLASFTPEQLEYFTTFPVWYSAIWALAVWSAVLGSVFLLVRQSWAELTFGFSLIFYIVSSIYIYGFTPAIAMMGVGGVGFSLLIGLSLLALLWFSRWSRQSGWIG